jgi:molybdate transport system substrate-binding protein
MIKNVSLFIIFLCLSFTLKAEQADQLRIAVAANFYSTLSLIKKEFEKEHNDELVIIKGSTGKLYAQIKHGAPYDIFMAADVKRPRILEQQGLTEENSRYTYANGLLVLWSKKHKDNVLSVLEKGEFKKLAMANPKTAPYGQAAKEVIAKLGFNAITKNKTVYGENIAQAFQFVQSGSADLGFVALSHVKPVTNKYWHVPETLYHSIRQQMVILKRAKNKKLATKFAEFLKTEKVIKIIKQQGYII